MNKYSIFGIFFVIYSEEIIKKIIKVKNKIMTLSK